MTTAALPPNVYDKQEDYDAYAKFYDQVLNGFGYKACTLGANFIVETFTDKSGKILDTGCGTGLLAEELIKYGYSNIDGSDLSTGMLDVSREKGVFKRVFQQDLVKFPYDVEGDTYDLTVCIGVNHLISQWKDVLQELARITKPGGMVIFSQRMKYIELWDYPTMLKNFEDAGIMKVLKRSTPEEYCPSHPAREGADRLLVFFACHVL